MGRPATVRSDILEIAYESSGPAGGPTVVLVHGFPYDPRCFDEVAGILAAKGFRAVVPYVRGYGPTRFLSAQTMRSGEQAAIGRDLLDLLDALKVEQAILAGFDWGARAACIVAALWPERVRALVSCCGYQIQDVARGAAPGDPEQERRFWYQYYFHTERGRAGLAANRHAFCKLLWQLWSPTWAFDNATYARSAASFDNPDFVDVVIHSYRHRHGNAPGDPRYAAIEAKLAQQPRIDVPTIVLHGAEDDVNPPRASQRQDKHFGAAYERRMLENVGHNPAQEAPAAFAQAILDLD